MATTFVIDPRVTSSQVTADATGATPPPARAPANTVGPANIRYVNFPRSPLVRLSGTLADGKVP